MASIKGVMLLPLRTRNGELLGLKKLWIANTSIPSASF